MAAGELQAFRSPERKAAGAGVLALALIIMVATMAGVGASPFILQRIYAPDRDYSVAGDVGQAYGGASAVVAAIALLVVGVSVLVQCR